MKKFLFRYLLPVTCRLIRRASPLAGYLLLAASSTFAHSIGPPIPVGGCPTGHIVFVPPGDPLNPYCIDTGCTDTDPTRASTVPDGNLGPFGNQIYTQGNCSAALSGGAVYDSCRSSSELNETYCVVGDNNNCWQTWGPCPSGYICSSGACVASIGSICTDTDPTRAGTVPDGNLGPFGNQIYTQGNCSAVLSGGTVFDSCRSSSELNETYCVVGDNNNCWQTWGPCPSGYTCSSGSCVSSGGGGGGGGGGGSITALLGRIIAPAGVIPDAGGNPSGFIAGLVRNIIKLLMIIAFIVAFIWTILGGFRFIFAGGDPKNVSSAWSQIYWGLIGLAVVLSSFAIIRIAEIFFNVSIISGNFQLPR